MIFNTSPFLEAIQTLKSVRSQARASEATRNLADIENIQSEEDLDIFLNSYYQHPRPEQVTEAIGVLGASDILEKDSAAAPIVGFFSELFSVNPDKIPQWQAIIEKQPPRAKDILKQAILISKNGGILRNTDPTPQLNDMCWGAFLASGRADYIRQLINHIKYFNEQNDPTLFITAGTARWSLASMAIGHKAVRSILEAERDTLDGRSKHDIEKLLSTSPDDLHKEMEDIVRKKQASGEWSS
ncbi:hypothetical protein [Pseudogulbenkiania sp. MAI-1]|uniref:hypothetical protein n=1 Tax=Pseudogulbenkiania sp. MAI-1 TaxID=990370 RepID=UPI0012EC20A1|nr:hypothetical protein [Pseudogulbenkiania sp. MAI-1]